MSYHRSFEIYKTMFFMGEINPGDIIAVRSIYPNIEDRPYFVVRPRDGRTKYQLEDCFGGVTARKILKNRDWRIEKIPTRFK